MIAHLPRPDRMCWKTLRPSSKQLVKTAVQVFDGEIRAIRRPARRGASIGSPSKAARV